MGEAIVKGAIRGAQRFGAKKIVKGPEPGEPLDGVPPGKWKPRADGLPENCPVTPLGKDEKKYFFLDGLGQFVEMEAREFSQNGLFSLFGGDYKYLWWAWPLWKKTGVSKNGEPVFVVSNFKSQNVSAALMAACAMRGVWRTVDRRRGRGAWRGKGGRLILHCGDVIYDNGRIIEPGLIDGHVYPASAALPPPWPVNDAREADRLILKLFELLRRWRYRRQNEDPILLLGAIAAGFLGGALDWRTVVYILGGHGTGKSTLQQVLNLVMGEWRFFTVNTTAAGIYQNIGYDSIAVGVDEAEGGGDDRRAVSIIELAREAASGGFISRGGADHGAVRFQARSSFIFSSINTPTLKASDLSRMAFIKLKPFGENDIEPELLGDELRLTGQMILARLQANWHKFPAIKADYDAELRAGGHNGRGCATFGTLLALADITLGDMADNFGMGGDKSNWREWLNREAMEEFEDNLPNWHKCLDYLLMKPVDAWRGGGRISVGAELEQFYRDPLADLNDINTRLAQAGVKLCRLNKTGGGIWLAVPGDAPQIAALFAGSDWSGGWKQALMQGEEGKLWRSGRCRISGAYKRCVMISLNALYGPGGIMAGPECTDDDNQ